MEETTLKEKISREERYSRPSYYYRSPIYIKNGKKYFYRFTWHQRIMHVILFASVLTLIITGIPLKYTESSFWVPIYQRLGGIQYVPIFHHIAGVVLCLLFVYSNTYFSYIFIKKELMPLKRRGELTLKSALIAFITLPMIPNLKDFKDFFQNLKYIFFISDKKPAYDKFMWKEKFDFFAVYWGIPLLGPTGFLIWQKEFFSHFVPGIVLNISMIAHSDEALLAATYLVVWHLYNVHFHLHKFPAGKVFLTGYLAEEEMIEEHYAEYVSIMKQEGFENEIKGQYHEELRGRGRE